MFHGGKEPSLSTYRNEIFMLNAKRKRPRNTNEYYFTLKKQKIKTNLEANMFKQLLYDNSIASWIIVKHP